MACGTYVEVRAILHGPRMSYDVVSRLMLV